MRNFRKKALFGISLQNYNNKCTISFPSLNSSSLSAFCLFKVNHKQDSVHKLEAIYLCYSIHAEQALNFGNH